MAENQQKVPNKSLAAEMFVFEEAQEAVKCDVDNTKSLQLPSEFYQYFQIEEAA